MKNPHGGGMPSLFPLVVACSLAASAASRAQPADVAALALYEGADREQRLVKGARTEREINLYSSLVLEDLNALAAAFDKKYGVKLKFWRAGSEKSCSASSPRRGPAASTSTSSRRTV